MKKTKVLLLACACLLTLAASRPARSASTDCLTGYFCQNCPATPIPEKRLCKETICNGVVVSVICSSQCSTNCILPPG